MKSFETTGKSASRKLTSRPIRAALAVKIAFAIMAANVTLSNCEITANRNGVLVFSIGTGNSIAIHGCNLTNNTETAVRNSATGQFVDAEGNWWGSVAGPSATNPNAVQNADGTNWLLAPVVLQY